jgi:hypothetical protein
MDTPNKTAVPGAEAYAQIWQQIAEQQARLEQQMKDLQGKLPGAAASAATAPTPVIWSLVLVPGELGKVKPVLNLDGLNLEQFATMLLAVVNIVQNTPAAGWQLFARTPLVGSAAQEAK